MHLLILIITIAIMRSAAAIDCSEIEYIEPNGECTASFVNADEQQFTASFSPDVIVSILQVEKNTGFVYEFKTHVEWTIPANTKILITVQNYHPDLVHIEEFEITGTLVSSKKKAWIVLACIVGVMCLCTCMFAVLMDRQ